MSNQSIAVKGMYCIAVYICFIFLGTFVEIESAPWIASTARWASLPLLILFFYLNTAIDTKFEKQIFFGLILFTICSLLEMAKPVIGSYLVYILIALMIIAYFSYARALIATTSISSTLFFRKKWLAGVIFFLGLIGVYFIFVESYFALPNSFLVPLLCFGLTSLFLLMAGINLINQIEGGILTGFWVSIIFLLVYNCYLGLKISSNISIFETPLAIAYYLGQLVFVWTAVRASLHFKKYDHSNISNVLKKKVVS